MGAGESVVPADPHMDRPLGYLDQPSYLPGDLIQLRASGSPGTLTAVLVDLTLDEAAQDASDLSNLPITSVDGWGFRLGSTMTTDRWSYREPYRFRCMIQVTRLPAQQASIVSFGKRDASWSLEVSSSRRLVLLTRFGTATTPVAELLDPLTLHRWAAVEVEVAEFPAIAVDGQGVAAASPVQPILEGTWTFAGRSITAVDDAETLDCRISDPEVWANASEHVGDEAPEDRPIELLRWRFDQDMGSAVVAEEICGLSGRLVNMPTRAIPGPSWDGALHHWPSDPAQWNAIHFHSDDIEDANWPVVAQMELPELASGVYGLELRAGDQSDCLPLVIRPRQGAPMARTLVLLPTLTYLAYGNEPHFEPHEVLTTSWYDDYAERHHLLSLYNWHADGSGVALASWRRPLPNLRPDYKYWLTGCPHGLGADLALLRWLRAENIPFDVATDHDLHRDGVRLLAQYKLLVTGAHPEYWSRPMMTALTEFLGTGGRLAYLGGNGFASLVGVHPEAPHIMELRRRSNGPGLWDAGPGELTLATTGEQGGYWRHHLPSSRNVTGLDTAGMGFSTGRPYIRTEAARNPRAAFIFEGVESESFGESGTILGAAAAYEVDSADLCRGTPEHALIVATASGFEAYESLEQTGHVRADVVFFETPSGGAVFGVGSIAWSGALGDESIGRITRNVLDRFAAPDPFSLPD